MQILPLSESVAIEEAKRARRQSRRQGLFSPPLLKAALVRAFVMLRPDIQWKNPVMFVVEVGTVLSIVYTVVKFLEPSPARPASAI
jgi:K+-transporting ATPase ATPase B chain